MTPPHNKSKLIHEKYKSPFVPCTEIFFNNIFYLNLYIFEKSFKCTYFICVIMSQFLVDSINHQHCELFLITLNIVLYIISLWRHWSLLKTQQLLKIYRHHEAWVSPDNHVIQSTERKISGSAEIRPRVTPHALPLHQGDRWLISWVLFNGKDEIYIIERLCKIPSVIF